MSVSTRPRCLWSQHALCSIRPQSAVSWVGFAALLCLLPLSLARAAPVARITIGPVGSGGNINASTFVTGSFEIENLSTAGESIESIRYEFANAGNPDASRNLFPDMVFDPNGSAGDTTAKPFSADSGGPETGFLDHFLDIPKGTGGFGGLALSFGDFQPGESFSFSIDVDPTSIQGVGAPGPGESGSVSGLELVATRVVVGFHNGSSFTLEGETFTCQGGNPSCSIGNVQASEVLIENGRPPAPFLNVLGTPTPSNVEVATQTVQLTGTPGNMVVLLVVEGALFLDGVPGGGFDLDAFEANSAVSATGVTEYTATLDGTGVANIAITLSEENVDEGGINHLAAIEIDSAGRTSDVSNIEVLNLSVISFAKATLAGASLSNPTTLQFGPDGRLYVGQQNGDIKILTVNKAGPSSYNVSATEVLSSVRALPNYDDDGALNTSLFDRQVTGLLVTGTAANPVIYVGSSDPRIGAGPSGNDTNLDTNSGILTRLTWNGSSWDHLDLVRGLPRSEENHSINGLELDTATNTLYATIGGFTNLGAPSNNFARIPEYALSAAILAIDLDAIGNTTYDLPTLDDEDRGGAGQPAENDPFGGNNGKNQAIIAPGGPVQVHSPGWRNPYDVVLTETGRLYTVDNGGNGGWGDVPQFEGPAGVCTNLIQEPGGFTPDNLHFVSGPGYYGGHPNPTRGNTANTFNPSNPQSPVPVSNPIECDFRTPGSEDGALATFAASTNGLTEYRASTFDGQMRGDLLMAGFGNEIQRVKLDGAGTSALLVETLFSSVGSLPLDLTTQDNNGAYPGTIWVGDYIAGAVVVYEPNSTPGPVCTGADDPALDEDFDNYDNADEIDNGTNPCSAGDVPPDVDGDFLSDLNDPDDDNDGQPDTSDRFAIDASNGSATTLPVLYSWDNGAPPAGGLLGLGFTGLMTDGVTDYADLFDPDNMAAGGAAGVTTVELIPPGDAQSNTQEYGFQFGFGAGVNPFVASTLIAGPFAGQSPSGGESMGLFVGLGEQDHYVKIVVTPNGVESGSESAGAYTAGASASLSIPGPDAIELQLHVDPIAGVAQPRYRVTTGGVPGPLLDLGAPIPLSWISSTPVLAAGILSTSMGGTPFPATWDFLHVVAEGVPLFRVNAGGPTVPGLDGAGDWVQDTGFANTGRVFSTTDAITFDASVPPATPPEVFQSERWDDAGAPEMSWTFPVNPGSTYEVRLYFAEIYNGIDGPGQRVFDVAVDGGLVLDDFDIVDEIGADVGTRRSVVVAASTSTLTIAFLHVIENPKLSAIEIFASSSGGPGNTPPLLTNPGSQSDPVASPASLALSAFDPDPDTLTYGAANLPAGLSIHPNTGVISGTPTTVEAPLVTVSVDDGVNPAVTQMFTWTISAVGNTPPLLTNPGSQSDTVGDPVSLALSAFDPDPDTLTYGAANLPAGVSIHPNTGVISGAPTTVEAPLVTVSVNDGVNPAVTQMFTWTISAAGNTPPLLANPGSQSDTVGSPVSLALVATDPDPDLLTYGALNLPANLSIDTTTGVISGTPTDAESKLVTVSVDDGVNPPATAVFTWTIVDPGGATLLHRVNAGGPTLPALDGLADWVQDTGFVNDGGIFSSSDPIAVDPSVPPLTPTAMFQSERWDRGSLPTMSWSFPVVPGASYEVRLYFAEIYNGITAAGQRVFDVAIDGLLSLDDFDIYGLVGSDVGVMRSAVVSAASTSLIVDFLPLQQHPKIAGIEIWALSGGNAAPVLTSPGALGHEVGDLVSVALSATDPEMDPLTFGATNLPDGLGIDPVSGVITGTPTTPEIRSVVLSVDDGNHPPTSVTILWTISAPGNPAPILTNPGDQLNAVGDAVSLPVVATDDDPLTFVAMNLPAGLSIDPGTGLISGSPTTPSMPTVTVSADDGVNPPVAEAFVWTVVDPAGGTPLYRVNAGGPTLPAADGGLDWVEDGGFWNTGSVFTSAAPIVLDATVTAGAPSALFQSERWDRVGAPEMTWSFPVNVGASYEVRIYLAEIWFSDVGKRIFDVSIDAVPHLTAFDIAASVGAGVGTMRSTVVTATSSILRIDFAHVLQNPKVSAIEILSHPAP